MGAIQVFQESDYRYGVGSVTLRIERVDRDLPDTYDGDLWYFVEGMQLTSAGEELGRRQMMVRASSLSDCEE